MRRPLVLSLCWMTAACGGSGSGPAGSDETPDVPLPPAVTCPAPLVLADVSRPTSVVGTGTAASCTEALFAAAVAAGGVITFACGPDPVVIGLTSEKAVSLARDTVIDGGGVVTLSGQGRTRLLALRSTFDKAAPTLRLQRLTLRDGLGSGSGLAGGGGAVYLSGGTVEAVDCVFSGNTAAQSGPDVGGGAIFASGVGDIRVVGTVFQGNRASSGGAIGALYAAITAVDDTFTGNSATGSNGTDGGNGGAIAMDGEHRTLLVCGSSFTGNTAGYLGSAIFRTAYHTEPTTIDRSLFQGNRAPRATLYFMGTALTVTASTIAGNTGTRGWGGVYVSKHTFQNADVPAPTAFTNVTLAGNDAGSSPGGALWVGDTQTPVTLTHVTLASNRALFAAGVGGDGAGVVTYRDTLVAGNVATNDWNPVSCAARGAGAVLQWPPTWGNGSTPDTPCATATTFADPLLQPLSQNGGPTPTMALATGSPALGAGTVCTGDSATDQRGHERPATGCALGAYQP